MEEAFIGLKREADGSLTVASAISAS